VNKEQTQWFSLCTHE